LTKVKYATMDYFKLLQEAINKDPIFTNSDYTSTWAYIFTDKTTETGLPLTYILTWENGRLKDVRLGTPDEMTEYKFKADYKTWTELVQGKLDASRAMFTGKYKMEGPMSKLMKYSKVLGHLTDVTKTLDVEY